QYGSVPLVSGPDFDARLVAVEEGSPVYAATEKDGKDHYALIDYKPEYKFDRTRIFPRVWDFNDPAHVQFYRAYLDLPGTESPTGVDNLRFFFSYQLNWMYWRYFMWKYAGRQNDMEGQGEAKHGNWISGIKPVDKLLGKGDVDKLPISYRTNRARNELYFLPFVLGLIGLYFHFK